MSVEMMAALARGDWCVPLPCELEVGGSVLVCRESLRLLPGKRVTIAGEWCGQAVVAKLFLPRAAGELEAENSGYRALHEAAIDTPEMLWSGRLASGLSVVIYRYLRGACSMAEVLRQGERTTVLRDCFALLSRLHRAGLWQSDIHFDNFLYAEGRVYVIDNASVRSAALPLSPGQALHNLAHFVAQFSWVEREALFEQFSAYGSELDLDRLRQLSARFWWKRALKYLRKIYRNCTEMMVCRGTGKSLTCKRHLDGEWMAHFLGDPDGVMSKGEILKDGNSATVVRSEINGRAVVIKRYNLKNAVHRARRSLRKTRAWNAWRAAHLLQMAGIPTPEPLALLERRWGPFRGVSYLVTDYVPGDEMLDVYQSRGPSQRELEQTASIFRVMHQLRLCHGDFKARNFLVTGADVQLLDLDVLRERRCPPCFRRCEKKDRLRFLRNWEKQPTLHELFEALIKRAVG